MPLVFLGLGTNINDRIGNLRGAIQGLKKYDIQAISLVYETLPWGYTQQESFLNMVISVDTTIDHIQLLDEVKKLEELLGREMTFRWGPRVIDIDILYYGDSIIDIDGLQIPHPQMINRAFVMVPLVEIASNFVHPQLQISNQEILSKLNISGIEKYKFQPFTDEFK